MIIRHATTADAGMLSELGARTFSEAFATDNTLANLDAHLRNSFSPEIQHRELSRADTIFLIAEADGHPLDMRSFLSIAGNRALKEVIRWRSEGFMCCRNRWEEGWAVN